MLPMAGLTPRSVFPTAMAAAAVPGTPLTGPAAVPRRTCRKPTASACITVSRVTRMTEKHTSKPLAHVLCTLTLASCLMLAQQNAPNTQGITPPPGSPTPTPARMTFFVTSLGLGKGGDLGGLAGADAHCQALAAAVGAGGHTWHAYLSTQDRPGRPAVNARDRIGTGPWFNWSFAQLGAPQNAIVSADLAELHGDTLVQAQRGSNLFKQSTRNEQGQVIHGVGDAPPIMRFAAGVFRLLVDSGSRRFQRPPCSDSRLGPTDAMKIRTARLPQDRSALRSWGGGISENGRAGNILH